MMTNNSTGQGLQLELMMQFLASNDEIYIKMNYIEFITNNIIMSSEML